MKRIKEEKKTELEATEERKEGLTELVFIIDKSGSMSGFEADTVGGFNSMIEKQRAEGGEVLVSTVLFDNESEVVHDRVPIRKIVPMTRADYRVGGCTALLDAVGGAIRHIGNVHKYARREDVPQNTVFVITTDGMENASRSFDSARVHAMIERQREKYGWEFIFLAANIDAIETAEHIGIRRERAANYSQSSDGYEACFSAMSSFVSSVRSAPVASDDDSWKASLGGDSAFKTKKKK